jgi:hypothetical protein
MVGRVDEILTVLKKQYSMDPEEALITIAREYLSSPEEVASYIELLPEITPEDLLITIHEIDNPNPLSRFVWEPNQITLYDKNGDIESEPKDWIKFGGKWYFKPDIIKK